MIQHDGRDQAPGPDSTPDLSATRSTHQASNRPSTEPSLEMPSLMEMQLGHGTAAPAITPAYVVARGTREFDTGLRIHVQALSLAT